MVRNKKFLPTRILHKICVATRYNIFLKNPKLAKDRYLSIQTYTKYNFYSGLICNLKLVSTVKFSKLPTFT